MLSPTGCASSKNSLCPPLTGSSWSCPHAKRLYDCQACRTSARTSSATRCQRRPEVLADAVPAETPVSASPPAPASVPRKALREKGVMRSPPGLEGYDNVVVPLAGTVGEDLDRCRSRTGDAGV